ncbi:MAG: very short patch repair endonuclease [Nitrososphaerales archaeon]
MTDVFTKEKRSWIMSRIRSKDTMIEKTVAQGLTEAGIAFEQHCSLTGKPDFVIRNSKLAIFLDGDFWHGQQWKRDGRVPANKYWKEKIKRNMERDRFVNKTLRKEGWKVLRFWETEIERDPSLCIRRIIEQIG